MLFEVWFDMICLSRYTQNRESTEGYSKSIVRKKNDKFGKRIGLNK